MDGIGLDGPDEDKTAHCEERSKIDNEANLNRNVMGIKCHTASVNLLIRQSHLRGEGRGSLIG